MRLQYLRASRLAPAPCLLRIVRRSLALKAATVAVVSEQPQSVAELSTEAAFVGWLVALQR